MDHTQQKVVRDGGKRGGEICGWKSTRSVCEQKTMKIVEPFLFFLLFFHFPFLLGGTGMRMAHFCAWSGQQDGGREGERTENLVGRCKGSHFISIWHFKVLTSFC